MSDTYENTHQLDARRNQVALAYND